MCRGYSRPKIKFLKERLTIGYEGNLLTYFIGVYNEIPTGWRQDICKRHTATGCKANVKFTIEDKLLASLTWWDSELGEILYPDSQPHEFPLVSAKAEIDTPHGGEEVFLEGTNASTKATIPPLKIPLNCHITARISIISSGKEVAVSKWDIAINPSYFSPLGVKRLE